MLHFKKLAFWVVVKVTTSSCTSHVTIMSHLSYADPSRYPFFVVKYIYPTVTQTMTFEVILKM